VSRSTLRSPIYGRREGPDAAHRLSQQLNVAGALDRSVVVTLVEPDAHVGTQEFYVEDQTTDNVSSTSYVDGAVSITVAPPAGGVASVAVHAQMTCVPSAATTTDMYLAIGDGTSEYGEQFESHDDTSHDEVVATSYCTSITETTTFVNRVKRSGGNFDMNRQTMSAQVLQRAPSNEWRQLGFIAEDDVVFRRALLIRSAGHVQEALPGAHYRIKVCLMEKARNRVEVLAEFRGDQRDLGINDAQRVTGEADLETIVVAGNSIWVCVERHGDPPPFVGTALQLTYGPKGV
jgi:hypothetical protein